jgi:CRP-like cAMP-binding protein
VVHDLEPLVNDLAMIHCDMLEHLESVPGIGVEENWDPAMSVSMAMSGTVLGTECSSLYPRFCIAYDKLLEKSQIKLAETAAGETVKNAVRKGISELKSEGLQVNGEHLDLSSLLILPVQRLPRYVMLVQEAVKGYRAIPTCHETEELKENELLLKNLRELTESLNRTKRISDMHNYADMVGKAIGIGDFLVKANRSKVIAALADLSSLSPKRLEKQASSGKLQTRFKVENPKAGLGKFFGMDDSHDEHGCHDHERDFVEELLMDYSATSDAGRKAKPVHVFVFTDILVATMPRIVKEEKNDTGSVDERVVFALAFEDVADVKYFGDGIQLTEQRRSAEYPFILEQSYWLKQSKKPLKSTLALTGSGENLAFPPVSRLFQALIPCLPGNCKVTVQSETTSDQAKQAAQQAALEEVLASRGLSAADWNTIRAAGDDFPAARGDVLVQEGQLFSGLFFILEGMVAVYRGSLRIAELREGDFFGELSLITDVAGATCTVYTESARLIRVLPEQLLHCLSSAPTAQLAENFFRVVVNSLSVRSFNSGVHEKLQQTSGKAGDEIQISEAVQQLRLREGSILERDFLKGEETSATGSAGPTRAELHQSAELARVFECPDLKVAVREFPQCEFTSKFMGKANGTLFVMGAGIGCSRKYFGFTKRQFIPWSTVTSIESDNKKLHISASAKDSELSIKFRSVQVRETCEHGIETNRKRAQSVRGSVDSPDGRVTPRSDSFRDPWELSTRGWVVLRTAGQTKILPADRDNIVVAAGKVTWPPTIWQVATGKCRVQLPNGTVLGTLAEGDVFGEMSFLFGGAARATVVALKLEADKDAPQASLSPSLSQSATMRTSTRMEKKRRSLKRTMSEPGPFAGVSLFTLTRPKLRELFVTEPQTIVKFYRAIAKQLSARMIQSQKQ